MIALFISGILVGAILLAGAGELLEATNSTEFCISCHELEQTVYQEYLKSAHYKNASGVSAECQDCHVPKALWPKLIRKAMAWNDVYHKLRGTIDTPEKFEARRELLAERVWNRLKESDSGPCRSCHSPQRMDFHKQSRRAQEKMKAGMDEGKTCIECHKGIAHNLPEEDD